MNFSIKDRLTFGSLFLYALMMFSVVLGLYYIITLNNEAKEVLADNYDSVRHVHGMQVELDRPAAEHERAIIRIDSLLAEQEKNITEPGERQLTNALRAHIGTWKAEASAAHALLIRRDIDAILALNLDAIERKSAMARVNGGHALFWLFLLAVLITLVGLGFSVAFPSVMSKPIVRLKEAVTELAAHNYRHRLPPFRMKELDELATAFNEMAGELEAYDNSNLARLMAEKNRAEAVINTLQDASVGVDKHGVVLFANRHALELLGFTEQEIVGRSATETARRSELLEHLLKGPSETPLKASQNGREQFFIASHMSIEGPQGSLGTLYMLHNITSFQERDLAKTNFLATISHELKTPLASSDIGLTLLERAGSTPLSAEQQAIITDLRKDHQRLVRIVGELLDLAQTETGNMRFRMAGPLIADIVKNALDAVRTAANEKDVHFDVRVAEPGRAVHADADKATWALVNLLSNAVRHSPRSGVVIVAARMHGDRMEVTVTDQGTGVPPEKQGRMFQRFIHDKSPSYNGSGLGLAIAREVMQAMGGSISFDPRVTTGASFTLTFAAAR